MTSSIAACGRSKMTVGQEREGFAESEAKSRVIVPIDVNKLVAKKKLDEKGGNLV